jgi:formamidopyrimidine-DNA glycosylase
VTKDSPNTYYKAITDAELAQAKKEIDKVLKSALNREDISKKEFEAMSTKDKGPGKFYQIYKVHKEPAPPNLPPGCPIISGCGSLTENLSLFVDHHAKHLVQNIPSYLQITPDFLRH